MTSKMINQLEMDLLTLRQESFEKSDSFDPGTFGRNYHLGRAIAFGEILTRLFRIPVEARSLTTYPVTNEQHTTGIKYSTECHE